MLCCAVKLFRVQGKGFQVLIVAGLLLTGAARQACSAVQLRCLRTGDRDWQLSTELLYIVSSGSDAGCPGIYVVSRQGIQWVQAWGLASLSSNRGTWKFKGMGSDRTCERTASGVQA